jgi:sugar lactone lactonase YvrE
MPRPTPVRLPLIALAAALLAIGLALAAASVGTAGGKHSKPDTIALPDGWQPEGIASGRGNELFVGSIPTGKVLRVDPKRGTTREVVPQREGRAAIGLKYHQRKLFVAGGPTGRAFVYDARTGDDVANVQLTPPPTFINDVTVTRRGAFFTDSQRQQLYRLDPRTNTATTIPITGDYAIDDDPETFEANGIAAAKGGRTLLMVQSRTGALFTVDPSTGASKQVQLTGGEDDGKLTNADGILLKGRTLYVVQNRQNQIAVVRLSGDLTRGVIQRVITDSDLDVPTTVARLQGDLFAVNARFGTPPTATTDYDVVRLREGGRKRGGGTGRR